LRELKFDYTLYPATPPEVRPAKYVYRPVIALQLSRGRKTTKFDGLIDSGADQTTFPGWIAEELGYNLHKGQKRIFVGIGGSVLAYRHKIQLILNGNRFTIDAFFSHDWDDMPFGLLGQESFFSRFDVSFNYRDKTIILKR